MNTDFGLDWSDYGARYYDAAIGRWGQVDPLAEMYYSTSGYAYVLNNPIGLIAPDGRSAEEPNDWFWNKKTEKFEYFEGKGANDKIEGYDYYGISQPYNPTYNLTTPSSGESNSTINQGGPPPAEDFSPYSIGPFNVEFFMEGSANLELGIVYKMDKGTSGITIKGLTINALDLKGNTSKGGSFSYLGEDGKFSGSLPSFQVEGGRDLKGTQTWGYSKQEGLSYDGFVAAGKPGVETSLGRGGLQFGIQEDIGNSFGFFNVIGGAYTFDIRAQFKITLK